MTQPQLVIMAAGMGSRYKGLKQLDGIGPSNETLMDYSIYDAIQAGFEHIILIIRKDFEKECREQTGKRWESKVKLEYAFQEMTDIPFSIKTEHRERPWGTGHALLAARDFIRGPFAILNADDYYGRSAFESMYRFLKTAPSQEQAAMVGYKLKATLSPYGSVTRGVCQVEQGRVSKVDEISKITLNGETITPDFLTGAEWVSMNFWGFSPQLIPTIKDRFANFLKQHGEESKSEFLIPNVVNDFLAEGRFDLKLLPSESQWFGMTYQEDKAIVKNEIGRLVKSDFYPAQL